MCKEAKEDLEFIRIFNATPIHELIEEGKISLMGQFGFKRGDYFHNPEMGEGEFKKVERVDSHNLRAINDPRPYRKEECFWIPWADQLAEEAQQLPFALHKEAVKEYYKFQNHVLSTFPDEEQVLSYWMEKKYGKTWDFENQKWIKIDTS
jgi:hypothetical protein